MDFDTYNNTKPYASRRNDPEVHAAFMAETSRLYHKFKSDMFEELGIAGHPKAEKLFEIAYERGHSSGYSEIYSYAEKLVELLN